MHSRGRGLPIARVAVPQRLSHDSHVLKHPDQRTGRGLTMGCGRCFLKWQGGLYEEKGPGWKGNVGGVKEEWQGREAAEGQGSAEGTTGLGEHLEEVGTHTYHNVSSLPEHQVANKENPKKIKKRVR